MEREDAWEPKKQQHPPAGPYLQPHLLRIVWESHTNSISRLMIRDWREAGRQPHKAPDTGEVFVCQTGQLYQRERQRERQRETESWERFQSVSLHCVPVSLCLSSPTLNMSADSSSWCEPLLQLWLFVSLSYRLYQRLHFTSRLLWQDGVPTLNCQHWYRGFCFRSSAGLSVYKDTTLTSTAFCPASNITLSLTDRISFPLQLYFCYLQSSLQQEFLKINLSKLKVTKPILVFPID